MSESGRRPLVAGNWKMNLTEIWATALVDGLLSRPIPPAVEVAVAPACCCLRAVADRLAGTEIRLAAQNCHWEDHGAFTGEVSARMLAEMGVAYVIVGHSERRHIFGESDERIQKKVAAVRRYEMAPILCVGELEEERNEGRTLAVVERQLRMGLGAVRVRDGSEVTVAYEPVWAIGTGRNATATQVREVHRMIREQLAAMFGAAASGRVRVLYGGSVTPDNAGELLALDEVDGALVGGASLDAEAFRRIIGTAA